MNYQEPRNYRNQVPYGEFFDHSQGRICSGGEDSPSVGILFLLVVIVGVLLMIYH